MNETIVTQHKENFVQLQRAFKSGHVGIMACQLRETGEDVAVICAVQSDKDGQIAFVPFAMFFNGNPYEMLKSPIEIDEEKIKV